MSIVKLCPYDMEEHCKYERYYGEPMFSKCKNCEIKNNRRRETKNKRVVMTEKEIELFNKCGNLEAENENLKLRLKNFEEKISVLLSCKNCPENKGGLLCQKEYEDKCLAQKIQYIKELQEEFKNLKKTYRKQRNKRIDDLQKENTKLKTDYEVLSCSVGDFGELQDKLEEEQRKNNGLSDNLTKAKDHIKKLLDCLKQDTNDPQTNYYVCQYMDKAEQFIKENK